MTYGAPTQRRPPLGGRGVPAVWSLGLCNGVCPGLQMKPPVVTIDPGFFTGLSPPIMGPAGAVWPLGLFGLAS